MSATVTWLPTQGSERVNPGSWLARVVSQDTFASFSVIAAATTVELMGLDTEAR